MWQIPDKTAPIPRNFIRVYRLDFPPRLESCSHLQACLQPAEVQRLQRFKVEPSAIHYLYTRASLRLLLGKMLNVPPVDISFSYGPQGKPATHESFNSYFNVSHTSAVGLITLAPYPEIGVDIEAHAPSRDLDAVARRNFSPSEQSTFFAAASTEERLQIFFDTWTGKEACIKAQGIGLTSELQRFSVELSPPLAARAVSFEGDEAESQRWSLVGLPVGEGFSAAVALRSQQGMDYLVRHPPALFDLQPENLL